MDVGGTSIEQQLDMKYKAYSTSNSSSMMNTANNNQLQNNDFQKTLTSVNTSHMPRKSQEKLPHSYPIQTNQTNLGKSIIVFMLSVVLYESIV